MKLGKKIIISNSIIIALLAAVIAAAAAVAGTSVVRSHIRNDLIDIVSSRAAALSQNNGVIPADFDYDVSEVYLSVYLSDGTLKNGSFPAEIDLPIKSGAVSTVRTGGSVYYVYDFAVSLEGRDDIYLRGVTSRVNGFWIAAMVSVAVFAGIIAVVGIILNIVLVRRAVRPIEQMREDVNAITLSKDISRRLGKVEGDSELSQLASDYNYMLDSLEAMFGNHERFTSDVAHELRTPLTVIMCEAEYAAETEDIAEKNKSIQTVIRQSKRLKAITDSLLEFTRLANKLSVKLHPVDISALTEEILADSVFTKGITCEGNIGKDIMIDADETLYSRVLQNLVDNAVKYGREGGFVRVELAEENGNAVLKVADNGVGMSQEAVKHAFDRFYREESSRSDKKGLGLGLSLVKEIVRLFGAEISIKSKLAEGTEVTVVFPRSKTGAA